jgi:hypothetical protein
VVGRLITAMEPFMSTTKELSELFTADDADRIADGLNPKLKRMPPARGLSTLCSWYENDDEVMAVVSPQKGSSADIALSHGLFHCGARQLTLVLPAESAGPTRRRIPWLTTPVDVYTYPIGTPVPTLSEKLTQESVVRKAGGSDSKMPFHLNPGASEWIRELADWATEHPKLEAAHLSNARVWSCLGQRVLTIRGKARPQITAGIDAKISPAVQTVATGPLSTETLSNIQLSVSEGIEHATKQLHGAFAEHHLQQKLRGVPWRLRLEHPLLREVPAWRPAPGSDDALGRGFIDLVGLDSVGDLVLVETKLAADSMLVLQGLDYWIWAQSKANRDWLDNRLSANRDATLRLLYAVAGKGAAKPELSRYSKAHFDALDDTVNWRLALLTDWEDDDAMTVDVLPPRSWSRVAGTAI